MKTYHVNVTQRGRQLHYLVTVEGKKGAKLANLAINYVEKDIGLGFTLNWIRARD